MSNRYFVKTKPRPRKHKSLYPLSPHLQHKPALIAATGHICAHCQNLFTFTELTIDHIWPQARAAEYPGDIHAIENLQLLCRPCNGRKGKRVPNP